MRKLVLVSMAVVLGLGCASEPGVAEQGQGLTFVLPAETLIRARASRTHAVAADLRATIAKPPVPLTPYEQWSFKPTASELWQLASEADQLADGWLAELELAETPDQRDALAEQTEIEQLHMQMIMDRTVKANSAISNALKKFSEVAAQIVANLK